MVMIKIGQTAITGRVSGLWDKDSKSFKITRGKTKSDKKYQIFEISVSTKKDDVWVNGKGIKVMLMGDTKVDDKQEIGLVGRFQADNYTTKDGKEVRGNIFMANAEDMFTPLKWDSKSEAKPKQEEDENPWND